MLEGMERFREGERVRTRVAKLGLPVGTMGTLQRVFRVTTGVYEVAFDGVPQLVMMYRGELEPAEDEHEAGS
jgi:hypothetical protein